MGGRALAKYLKITLHHGHQAVIYYFDAPVQQWISPSFCTKEAHVRINSNVQSTYVTKL